ncbi:MAG: hypothetical protein SGI71_10165 [Verrucomicrobiota bacterium]|nr:hypothetical protein [Verrucomicrobiota bacterium]
MEVLTAVLCDSASDYNGKLCILGTFDTIGSTTFPCVWAQCALAFRFLFRETDVGLRKFRVSIIDSDGKTLLKGEPPRFDLPILEIPENTYFLTRNFILNMQGLVLDKPSLYSIDLYMDEDPIAHIPLQVIKIDMPPIEEQKEDGGQ